MTMRAAQHLALTVLWASVGSAHAHGGGLDAYGCHHDRKNGGYHCHGGSPAPAPTPAPAPPPPSPAPPPPAPLPTAPRFPLNLNNYVVVKTTVGFGVAPLSQPALVTVVTALRIEFADVWLALDIDGAPGSVYRLYRAAFKRTPDASGLGYHLGFLENHGLGLADIAGNFVRSPEFAASYGQLSNIQFVTLLYANVLGREPDAGGLAFHVDNLERGIYTRAQVLLQFAESPENRSAVAAEIATGIRYEPYVDPAALQRSPFGR
jgi:hypothetical protein